MPVFWLGDELLECQINEICWPDYRLKHTQHSNPEGCGGTYKVDRRTNESKSIDCA